MPHSSTVPPFVKFFKLEQHPELVEKATKPKSCGGTKEFKKLALEGDNLLNRALLEIFPEISDVGLQTKLRTAFHSRRTLVLLGQWLGLDEAINSHKPNHQATDNEIKEAIESLLAASYKVNGFKTVKVIVKQLLEIANKNKYIDRNWKGELNELFQKEKEALPAYDWQNFGEEHQPNWQCTILAQYHGKTYKLKSGLYAKKKDAEQDVAYKLLRTLGKVRERIADEYARREETKRILFAGRPMQSLEGTELRFLKTNDFINSGEELTIRLDPNKQLVEWARAKKETNPYFLLAQLSALFKEKLRIAAWLVELDEKEPEKTKGANKKNDKIVLLLLHLQLEGEHYFELGTGPSKTKAQKSAARKIITQANLLQWLELQDKLETKNDRPLKKKIKKGKEKWRT
ncbi:MAG: putative dsRNA-binding protein [Candidatus Heimdallarchaeota archaeon]